MCRPPSKSIRACAAQFKERRHRKPASSLSAETSICCKMAFPGNSAWKCSFYGRKLIAEATCCCSSDRQSRSCGLLMKGLRPLHTFPKFAGSLKKGHWPFLLFWEVTVYRARFQRIASLPPIYIRSGSGMRMLPSSLKLFSRKAMSMRGGATTVLFRVCGRYFLPSAPLTRMPRRRA